MRLIGLALSLPLCLSLAPVAAQSGMAPANCDFSQSIGSCEAATAPRADGGIFIMTDSLNCASVDYVADGRKRRVYVTEGRGEDVTAKEDVSVIGCTKFANIQPVQAPQPVQQPQTGGWQQPNGTVVGGNAPAAQLQPTSTGGDVYGQLAGAWCDVAGQQKLAVTDAGVNMMHKAGKNIPAPFIARDTNGMKYATKRLFTTYSGKIGLAASGNELIWEDRVSPGISKVHYLRSCN